MQQLANYIAAANRPPVNNAWLDNVEPATGKVYSQVPDSDAADLELAIAAGEKALPAWKAPPLDAKSRILLAVADGIERRLDELARAESTDTGKPLTLARTVEIPRAAANFRFFAAALTQFSTEAFAMPGE